MGKGRFVWWFFLYWVCVGEVLGKTEEIPQGYTLLHSVGEDWLVYDEGYGGYVPYMSNRHTKVKNISFWLDCSTHKPYRILMYAEKGTYLYIQKQLAYRFNETRWYDFSIDSLRKAYQETALFCTLYDGSYRLPLSSITIVIKHTKQSIAEAVKEKERTSLDRTPRGQDYKDWAILSFLLVVISYTILYNYNPKTFSSFFSTQSSLSNLSRKDPTLIQKPLGSINFVYLGAHGLLLSYFYLLWNVYLDNSLASLWLPAKTAFGGLWVNQLYYWLLAWGLLVGKILLLLFFGRLLNVDRQVVQIHLFEYLRFSYLFYSIFGSLGALVFCCYGEYNPLFFGFALYFAPIFHLLQAGIISFFVLRQVPLLNLYIFYYLCTTELTPWLIGIKSLLF